MQRLSWLGLPQLGFSESVELWLPFHPKGEPATNRGAADAFGQVARLGSYTKRCSVAAAIHPPESSLQDARHSFDPQIPPTEPSEYSPPTWSASGLASLLCPLFFNLL